MTSRLAPRMVSNAEDERDQPRRSSHAVAGPSRYASATEPSSGRRTILTAISRAATPITASTSPGTHRIQAIGDFSASLLIRSIVRVQVAHMAHLAVDVNNIVQP